MPDYGDIGNAGYVCSSGRSKGTIATRPGLLIRPTFCIRKSQDEYKSPWRKRKETRRQNRLDYEAEKNTSAVRMMKKNNIKVGKTKWEKWEPTETVEDEWVPRKYPKGGKAKSLMSKRGPYKHKYIPPVEIVKKKIKIV